MTKRKIRVIELADFYPILEIDRTYYLGQDLEFKTVRTMENVAIKVTYEREEAKRE